MRILLVEDDVKLNETVRFQLEKYEYKVDSCYDGEEALFYIREKIHDIILLDRMLPRLSGTQVLQIIRTESITIPVIMITALGTLDDKITGLNLGADDYLVKPFDFDELLARIRCVTRRPALLRDDQVLTYGTLTLRLTESRLIGTSSCSLSKKENELLEVFFRNPDQTLARSVLLSKVWGVYSDVEDGNLDNYIHFLRRRLAACSDNVRIATIRGIGYRLEHQS